ncbi:Phosphoribosylformylglycinamidine cyclo-ligase [Chlamydiales bacterium SCGC AG-110-M15]|nr:Phosphoribosylformylglycinamidine cyclo-ligase [Chlamydiales bacterium SCGC AG-110-M15]
MTTLNLEEPTRMIQEGDHCSHTAYSWAEKTFAFRHKRPGEINQSLKASYAQIVDYGSTRLAIASDGIGTKIEIAERMQIYDTLAYDLVAMVVDDLICNGAIPANLSNILDVDRLDHAIINDLMKGLHDAAHMASISITGGEIAELGSRMAGYGDRMHFNWCATGIGYLPEGREVMTGYNVRAGDAIIALASRGFRSNGYTLIRKVLQGQFGPEWHLKEYSPSKTWGELLLTPSLIYTPVLNKCLNSDLPIHALAHITGGGIANNLRRMLKVNRLGADLYDLFEPLPFMKHLQDLADLDDHSAYTMWNMGNGFLVVVPDRNKQEVLDLITENHYQARIAGVVTDEEDILITSPSDRTHEMRYKG